MQVLSQLSYNPTSSVIGPLDGALSVATRSDLSPGCSAGEFRVARLAGFHRSRLAVSEARAYCSRVIAFGTKYISRRPDPSISRWSVGSA
jgi:hypothetical protein